MEENNKAKKFMLFGLIVLVITIAVSSTYAYYVWTTSDSDTTKIVAGVGSATVTFDGGSDINASLRPVSDKSKGIIKNISVKADTTGLVFNMYFSLKVFSVYGAKSSFSSIIFHILNPINILNMIRKIKMTVKIIFFFIETLTS